MGRRSSGRFAPRPAPPPAPVRSAPTPAPASSSGGSMLRELGASIADGLGFGAGNAVAHRAVDAIVGPRTIQIQSVTSAAAAATPAAVNNACSMHTDAFTKCLNSSGSDISKCQFYMDVLNECRKNSGSMLSA